MDYSFLDEKNMNKPITFHCVCCIVFVYKHKTVAIILCLALMGFLNILKFNFLDINYNFVAKQKTCRSFAFLVKT